MVRVFYSFPHKLGADRICTTAWHQVNGASKAGAYMYVAAASISRSLPKAVSTHSTLAWRRIRIPTRILGTRRACALHDTLAALRLKALVGQIDVVHVWPQGAARTLQVARTLNIPTLLERPNAHTRFAYEVVQRECKLLGVTMPPKHEHAYDPMVLKREEAEYKLCDYLLCPSDFVATTFRERGFQNNKLLRHQYGFDESKFFPVNSNRVEGSRLTMLFAGGCAPRKGLHFALEAWLKSPACNNGVFLIAGSFIPSYALRLSAMLSHPSIKILGHRTDLPDLMRQSDILVLPSIEEGSALVTAEARGCGCVLLVSDAAGAICTHGTDSLIHTARDVETLCNHITLLYNDRLLLARLRSASLQSVSNITWQEAGRRLLAIYEYVKSSKPARI